MTKEDDAGKIVPERRPWNQEYFGEILSAFAKADYDALTFSEYFRLPRAEREETVAENRRG